MFRFFLALATYIAISPATAQEQIEKIFDPVDQDWQGKNLGQPGFANTSSARISDNWYFVAYNEHTKADIWKTDLDQTTLFIDLDDSEKPFIHGTYGEWLIYSDLQDESMCRFTALSSQNNQKIDLITGAECNNERFSNFSVNDKHLAVIVGNEVFYQDLSLLPTVSVRKSKINDNGVIFIRNIDPNSILLKDAGNPFGFAPFYILDMNTGSITVLNDLLGKEIHDVSQFVEYKGKYFFQITTEPYVERLVMSCDTNFSLGSISNHGNIWGDLLFIENDRAYLSDFHDRNNTLGIYDIHTFSRIDSLETGLSYGYSIWSEATKISYEKYILSSGSQSIFHYDLSKNELTSLGIDTIQQQFAIPWLTIDSGIVIRYRDNVPKERLFYFPFSDLKPREFYIQSYPRPHETNIFSALPGNKLLALVYDQQASSEYAVIDVLNDNYRILADIHTANQGNQSQSNFTYLLPDHQILIGVATEFGSTGFIFNPITRESNAIVDSNGKFVIIHPNGMYGNMYLYSNLYANGKTEFSHHGVLAHDDSAVYFIGNLSDQKELKLFAYNYKNRQLKSVDGIFQWDKIFKVGSEIYVIRNKDDHWNLLNRKVLHWSDNQLKTIFEAEQPDNCYDKEDIHQYFIHNDFLYFTISGKLFSLNSRNNEITLLVDNLINHSEGCYTDGIVYGNFLVKDNQVYFTESRSYMFYFYIVFVGFTEEIEQYFWKTDGTQNGTTRLTEMVRNQEFTDQSSPSYLFMYDNEIYMFSNLAETDRRLYKWTDNKWQALDVMINYTLNAAIPHFYYHDYLPVMSKPGANQRVEAHWDNTSYFQTMSYPPGMDYSPTMLGYVYSFKGGDIPELKKEREYIYSINSEIRSRDAFPTTQLGYKWYFPFNYREENTVYHYYPEIHQYNFSNNRLRNIINDNSMLLSHDGYIVKDEVLETGYFLLAEKNSYNAKVYRLNSCPLIDEPVVIKQANGVICNNAPVRIQLDGLSSMNWIVIKVNGVETSYDWEKESGNTFLAYLNLPEGKYTVSYFMDSGCGIDSIATDSLEINGVKPIFTITSEPESSDNIYKYTCSDLSAGVYQWSITGGNILSGQGTYSVTADWGQSAEGSISLMTSNGRCNSDVTTVAFSKITNTNDEKSQSFKIIPNPSSGNIVIELPEKWNKATYQLLNIDGKVLDSGNIPTSRSTLDFRKFPAGIYLMMLKNEDNIITQRLVLMD